MTPTVQQQAILDTINAGKANILVEARAGTGKTSLIVMSMDSITSNETIALAAFNKKIASELTAKTQHLPNVSVGTFHSFGFRAWRKLHPSVKVDDYKKWDRLVEECKVPTEYKAFVRKAISLAKQRAIGYVVPLNDPASWLHLVEHFDLGALIENDVVDNDEDAIRFAMDKAMIDLIGMEDVQVKKALQCSYKVLKRSIEISNEVIDFDDMIYLPLIKRAPIAKYDWVMVDEAQDTNPARREFAKMMMKPTSRAVFVGDAKQSIYGFTGADNDSLEIISTDFNTVRLPMTKTFRCGKAIVEAAKAFVPEYEAADTNSDGQYLQISQDEFGALELVPGQDAILCRNTKPLVETAFSLIRRGIPCHVEGKDIGKDIIRLVTRWKKIKTCSALVSRLEEYRETEMAKFLARKKEMLADAVADRVDTILVIIGSLDADATVMDLKDKVDGMFADTPDGQKAKTVTLMTVHRSKGLEYDRVFIWKRAQYMPSRFAVQNWQIEQENNLIYVGITRAINTLVEVS